jgi:GT2 family glycosyltransferase
LIPTCQRPVQLRELLSHVAGADEIVVSDDSQTDDTQRMLAEEFPAVRYLRGPRRGPAANRNHLARNATGEAFIFVDDDCVPSLGWLQAMVSGLEDAPVVEGKTVCPSEADDPFEERVENLTGDLLWSCNLGIRRTLFDQLGGFDEDFPEAAGEDMEFAYRVKQSGATIRFEPAAEVVHPARHGDWGRIWKRTWMRRWMVLYDRKTGNSPKHGILAIVAWRVWTEAATAARLTWHLYSRRPHRFPRRERFHVAWHWITLPLLLPYMVYWELTLRRRLRAKGEA